MARKQRSLVGIEFQHNEIRVVEVRHGGGRPVVGNLGVTPMPTGALQDGVIVRPDAVAGALQRLLEKCGINSREAVLGVPSNGVVVRTLNLPPSPDSELGMLVDGEVRHFQVIRSAGGAYGFFRIQASGAAEADTGTTVLLMGSEEPVVAGLRDVASRAGLDVVALEPAHVGLLRAAAAQVPPTGTTLLLTMSDWRADIIVVSGGAICVYRRIDVGFQGLLAARQAVRSVERSAEDEADELILNRPDPTPAKTTGLVDGPANTLAIEVRRSVEYFTREFSTAPGIENVVLAANDPEVEDVQAWLTNAVQMDVRIASPVDPVTATKEVAVELQPPAGVRYTAAYGFALRDVEIMPIAVPKMDLYVHERSVAEMEVKRRGLATSLVASIVAICAGVGMAYGIGKRANDVEQSNLALTQEIANLEKANLKSAEAEIQKGEQLRLLAQNGLPLTAAMDAISSSLPPSVGLTQVQISGGGVSISGESTSEEGLINFQRNLQQTSMIIGVNVNSFERAGGGLNFRISSSTLTGTPISAPNRGEVARG